MILALLAAVSCDKVTYKKTKSGMAYKIFPGSGKDSLIKEGNVVKYHVVWELNDDSVLFSSYGKAPQYVPVQPESPQIAYTMLEILPQMRKGDSGTIVLMTDTLMKKGGQLPFTPQKGDRIVGNFRIVDVFTSDSVARADFDVEMEKDRPRREKEEEERMAEQQRKEDEALEKSGQLAKQVKEVQDHLNAKGIKAQKTGKGTFVHITDPGSGAAAAPGKFVDVKYTGKVMKTDSVFQSSSYAFPLGKQMVIRGWEEGLLLFKEGGKGTLYIPGFLAYGQNPGPAGEPWAPLVFDIEVLKVSDTALGQRLPDIQR